MATTTTARGIAAPASFAERSRNWRWKHRQGVTALLILTPIVLYLLVFTWVKTSK